ncbi:MAG: hypothetical protein H0T45_15855, partial [Pyrinomonadaceae bacterium]|nr:hypothetical protein [Pyrinomonadaceae bacterium]
MPFALTAFGQKGDDKLTPPNLHQWGAVTLFHGLPSDRVRAIAQGPDGAMWFGTENGLAKYDGRRTQTVALEGLAATRVLALQFDADGALWVGTDAGAARLKEDQWQVIAETQGQAVNAILTTTERGRALLATAGGRLYDCRVTETEATIDRLSATADSGAAAEEGAGERKQAINVQPLPEKALMSAGAEQQPTAGPLTLTSLTRGADGTLYAGAEGRGVLAFAGGAVREVTSRPRAYFVTALEYDARGVLWIGARAGKGQDSGLYEARDVGRPIKTGSGIGKVNALRRGAGGELWVGTDGQGALRLRDGQIEERLTFEGTAGGLRSNHVLTIFVDREEVVWFGTERGVCRFDPHAARNERVAEDAESNFVRVLLQTKSGELLGGTNRGLFVYEQEPGAWRQIEELGRQTIYALAEDARGRLLVGTAGGLYAGSTSSPPVASEADDNNREASAPEPATTNNRGGAAAGVRAISVFQGQTYIAVYGRGVERLDGERRALVWPLADANRDESLTEVTALHADGPNRLWIGTARAGVFLYEGGRVSPAAGALDGLRGNGVWAIDGSMGGSGGDNNDGGRALWFATAKGVYALQGAKLSEAAPGVEARDVSADESLDGGEPAAWCATANGLLRVSLNRELGPLVSRLDVEQGLSSANDFAVLRVRANAEG